MAIVPKRAVLAAVILLALGSSGLVAQQAPPFRLDQVERLLLGEVHGIIADLSRECIAFDLRETNIARLRAAGADDAFIEALSEVCQRIRPPELNSISACGVRALLDVVQVRAERREYEQAFHTLARARSRVEALSTIDPGATTWRSFAREIDEQATRVHNACEAWRQIRLERGLPAPECVSPPTRENRS